MTKDQIKQRAREKKVKLEENQTLGVYDNNESFAYDKGYNSGKLAGYEEGYIAGAIENGIEWHDLRENPNDLPPMVKDGRKVSETVWLYVSGYGTDKAYYDYMQGNWIIRGSVVRDYIFAWCEEPQFEE